MKRKSQLKTNQARKYALVVHEIARDVFQTGKPADRILAARFRKSRKFGSRDRRMISETLFSVFRWWGWLSKFVRDEARLWQDDGHKLDQWSKILFVAHAMDNETFDPVSLEWKRWGKLEFIPDMAEMGLKKRAETFAKTFDVNLKHEDLTPSWLWREIPLPKKDRTKLLDELCKRPPMWIRIQRTDRDKVLSELRAEGLEIETVKGLSNAVNLGNPRVNLYELESFRKGRYEIQDIASQVIGLACQAQPGQRWWDACAGAGGKSLQLASMMNNRGTVVASDVRAYKLKDLKKRARRAGFSNISPKAWEGNRIPVKTQSFDGVLVDAPCTCTGTWRRNPDARWTTSCEDIDQIVPIQLGILERAAKAVKIGGALVYATCSMTKRENEEIVMQFLEVNANFQLDPIPDPISGLKENAMIRIWPWQFNSDATFVARMVRES